MSRSSIEIDLETGISIRCLYWEQRYLDNDIGSRKSALCTTYMLNAQINPDSFHYSLQNKYMCILFEELFLPKS